MLLWLVKTLNNVKTLTQILNYYLNNEVTIGSIQQTPSNCVREARERRTHRVKSIHCDVQPSMIGITGMTASGVGDNEKYHDYSQTCALSVCSFQHILKKLSQFIMVIFIFLCDLWTT